MTIREMYGDDVLEVMRYNLNYIASNTSYKKLMPTWIRHERSYSIKNIKEPNIIFVDNIDFESDDLDIIYPKKLIDYSYFEKVVNCGNRDCNFNFEFIELSISKKTIALGIQQEFIKSDNVRRVLWFSNKYTIPDDSYHDRGD